MSDQLRRYTATGGPVPGNVRAMVPRAPQDEHKGQYGVRRGYVQRAVASDDFENITGRLEYNVLIEGQIYKGVLDATGQSGIRNYSERVRSGITQTIASSLGEDSFPEETDGEAVWCLFIKGDADRPIIIGSDLHPRIDDNANYTAPGSTDGEQEVWEFNGLQFKIDSDGTMTFEIVPVSDPMTKAPKNLLSAGTILTLDKDGNFTFLNKTGTSIEASNADDSVTVKSAFGDMLSVSKIDGIQTSTPAAGGTSISCKAGKVDITAALDITVTSSSGSLALEGSGGKAKLGTGKVGLGGAVELLDLFDQTLAQISTMAEKATSMATDDSTHIHGTGVGPSSPPTTASAYVALAADFTAAKAAIEAIKTQLGTIKGGV